LSADTEPILDPIGFESYLFNPLFRRHGIVRADNFEEFAIAWGLTVRRDHAKEWLMSFAEPLEAQSDYHSYFVLLLYGLQYCLSGIVFANDGARWSL
jgi:hypothetical protein